MEPRTMRDWRRWLGCSGSGRLWPVALAVTLTLGLVVAGGLIRSALTTSDAPPKPDYHGTGVVVGLYPPPSNLHRTRPMIIIYHDVIPGLMDEKMSMPFFAASTKLFQGLRPGDRIAFGLKTTPDALLVVSLERQDGAVGR
jgi:hypothetical protein